MDTLLDISTDGVRLSIAPEVGSARSEEFDAAQEWARKRYGQAFEKLAK